MATLVLGPLLRHVGEVDAVVWVETDEPCEVEVLGHAARTFRVGEHHYGLVVVDGLEPGTLTDYEVALDDGRGWPPPGEPHPRIRTLHRDRQVDVVFGSCRNAAPHDAEWNARLGVDALRALALRLRESAEPPPHALLLLGDQVYVDEAAPQTRAFARARRDTSRPPGEGAADFEEYSMLYRESWGDPDLRSLLATVSTAMVFDDHELHDDWSISAAWARDMRREPWWEERVAGAFASYWLYQHLGNLSPQVLAEDDFYRRVRKADDGAPLLREMALAHLDGTQGTRWSYARELGHSRLVVVDSRAGRVLEPGRRLMVDEDEWEFVAEQARGDVRHLLLASSVPVLLGGGINDLQAWNERICDGAWGRLSARLGEKLRRAVDLDHWPCFQRSFTSLVKLLSELDRPKSILLLSGDVHYSYVAETTLPRVHQIVVSPFRNQLEPKERLAQRLALSAFGRTVAAGLARLARVPRGPFRWRIVRGPWFENGIGTLELDGGAARLRLEHVGAGGELVTSVDEQLR